MIPFFDQNLHAWQLVSLLDKCCTLWNPGIFMALSGGMKDIGLPFEPSYMRLHRSGELRKRGQSLWQLMENCELCPRMCGSKKLMGEKGFCGAGSRLMVSSFRRHFGEEKSLVGQYGSGTIFMTHCSLRCVFCSNWEISQGGKGKKQSLEDLANIMLALQEQGCPTG